MKLCASTVVQLWAAAYCKGSARGYVKLLAPSALVCSGINMVSVLWKAERRPSQKFQAHVDSALLKTINLMTSWLPNWLVSARSQGTCQPRKSSHRQVSSSALCPLGQNGCSWCELCNAASSNPNSSLVNEDGLNMDRMEELNKGEAPVSPDFPCLYPYSLWYSWAGKGNVLFQDTSPLNIFCYGEAQRISVLSPQVVCTTAE